ncbi:hypothetical protein J8M20_10000 [Pseudoalteromonas luteoviolacea]|uniref:hypothetical protein n=1 Tax=Pseudoalteromonas luteoviolacea TaxID=43657 RepID=UPI001B3597A8|nr:hypothetical protein [Pseudoalteromonas luteoviolacea]MBQ4811671.1 hypothetical protein [Pseudoalteromonas luteoviolacea]
MINNKKLLLSVLGTLFLGACSLNQNPEGSYSGDDRVNMAGAAQLLSQHSFVTIDLAPIIADMTRSQLGHKMYELSYGAKKAMKAPDAKTSIPDSLLNQLSDYDVCANDSSIDDKACILAREELNFAVTLFYSDEYKNKRQRIRNTVQDRIISASTQRCNLYKMYIKRVESRNNFWLGSVTTLFGGAGAIFTNESATRILSGLAGITSGVRAEFNQAYLANQATELIAKGIDLKRSELKSEMQKRKNDSLKSYSLFNAIGDAISFHGACNILTGLEVAGKAIDNLQDPGYEVLAQNLYRSKHLEEVMAGVSPTDFKYAELAEEQVEKTQQLSLGDRLMNAFSQDLTNVKDDFNKALDKLVANGKITAPEITKIQAIQDSNGNNLLDQLDQKFKKYKAAEKSEFNKLQDIIYFDDSKSEKEVELSKLKLKVLLQKLELFGAKVDTELLILQASDFDAKNLNNFKQVITALIDVVPSTN